MITLVLYYFLCFSSWEYCPISHFILVTLWIFATLWNLLLGGKFFVFLLVYFGYCLPMWDHSWCVVSCKSCVYSGGGPYFFSCCGCGRCLCSVLKYFSSFSVAISNILVSCSNAVSCLPAFIIGSFRILFIALVRVPAMRTALSIGVSCGAFTCFGSS